MKFKEINDFLLELIKFERKQLFIIFNKFFIETFVINAFKVTQNIVINDLKSK